MKTSRQSPRSPLLLALFLGLVLFCIGSGQAAAQAVSVSAQVSPKTVSPGESLTFTIVLASQGRELNTKYLTMPVLGTLTRLALSSSRPSVRISNSTVNGVISSSISLSWELQATAIGAGIIPQMAVTYAGKPYSVGSTQVIIEAPRELDLPGGILAPKTRDTRKTKQLEGKLFARLIVSNPAPYLQETFTVECMLYLDKTLMGNLSNLAWRPPVEWAKMGILARPDDLGQQITAREVLYGGKRFMAAVIGSIHLTPTKAGPFSIPLHAAQGYLLDSTQQRFSLFSTNALEVQLPLAATTINVQPLPTQGRPSSFAGAVGQFSFAASVDRTEATENDFVTLRCKVAGNGYAGSIRPPRLPDLPGWEQRETQEKNDTPNGAPADLAAKTFEFVLSPQQHGTLNIPSISYAYFDPKKKTYVELSSNPIKVDVSQSAKIALNGISFPSASPGGDGNILPMVPDTLAYIHTDVPASSAFTPVFAHRLFWPIQAIPLLLLGAAMGWRTRRGYVDRNRDSLRVKAAGGRARRELKAALVSLRKENFDAFHAQLAEALRAYVATKLHRPTAGLTLDEITHDCQERGVAEKQVRELRTLLEQCDMARYCSGATDARAEDLYQTASALLPELDKVFK